MLSCQLHVSFLNTPIPIIQFIEILHNLHHCLSFGLRNVTYQKRSTGEAVQHKNQEAELAESIL